MLDKSIPMKLIDMANDASNRETQRVNNQTMLIENQRRVINGNNSTMKMGLIFTFLLSAFCLVCAAYFVLKGYNAAAFCAAIFPAATFINTYFMKEKK